MQKIDRKMLYSILQDFLGKSAYIKSSGYLSFEIIIQNFTYKNCYDLIIIEDKVNCNKISFNLNQLYNIVINNSKDIFIFNLDDEINTSIILEF